MVSVLVMDVCVWMVRYGTMVGHKLVGVGYGYIGIVGGVYGFCLSVLIRLELGSVGLGVVGSVRDVWVYNGWITGHGLVMLFVFVMPLGIGGYGNYLVPMLCGCSEFVMPRMNGVSLWFLVLGV